MGLNPIEVQKALKGASYPTARTDLVARAEENGADEEVLERLRRLADVEYGGPDDVMERLASD